MAWLDAGKLDRRITLLTKTASKDGSGRPASVWAAGPTIWAEVQDMLPSRGERIAEGVSIANRPCRIRARYRTDIKADMRVMIDGRTLRIVSMPAELGRRDGIEFVAEELTTGGEEA